MAAMVSAWSTKPGAWALDSEQNESELLHQQQQQAASSADFPTLATAAATKTKKKKSQPLSLSQFNSDSFSSKSPSLTPDDILLLPTGPRQRSTEELDRSRLGGGFRSYGSYGDDSSRRPGGGFGLGRDRDWDSSSRDPLPPSRADEAPDWGASKRLSSVGSFERRDRDRERGGFFGSSKADEVDNWASGKSSGRSCRGWSRSGFEGLSNGNGADGDRWGRKREDDWEVNSGNSSSGRPRLVLQPRSVPVEGNANNKGSGKGSSPFGDARPREEVLKEKGKDWKEMEEKLLSVKIKDGTGDKWESNGGRVQQEERSWRKAEAGVADDDSVGKDEEVHQQED
ncbi:hypothetical protein MLD38_013895 [Melastoma candidum]|uniref:Uncharacterized protein n=1 Tax=Melastoma candidum TaxID=119954 RepID=A0ACB9RJH3_9MYRT|nr:hypothetical protein MLD38_013895 [Melastoma candidum]